MADVNTSAVGPAVDRPLPPAEFAAIYARVPRLTVEVVVTTPSGVVLTRRSIDPCRGQWHLPGGTVRFGELLPDAVRRVARNELGVEVAVLRMLGYLEYPGMHQDGYAGWPVGIAFEAAVVAGELVAGDQADEVGTFRCVPTGTIPDQAAFLDRWLRTTFHPEPGQWPGQDGYVVGR
ncbi:MULTISPECIES: NUDIX hydrolase [unclassified Micromonospora]|uniref:NUDIX hydrolase n=1 Tax=unclassified Micromonospora TaxID=2617518 RepID=UPI003641C719